MPKKSSGDDEDLRPHERLVKAKVAGRSIWMMIPIEYPCGAWTRAGTPCRITAVYASGRCKLHGGMSTGPKTEEGKERIREGQKRRRERERGSLA